MLFYQGDSVIQGLLFSCALLHNHNMSRFKTAGWLGLGYVRFLPKETQQQPGIDPGYQTWNLAITRPMPRPLSFYCQADRDTWLQKFFYKWMQWKVYHILLREEYEGWWPFFFDLQLKLGWCFLPRAETPFQKSWIRHWWGMGSC